MKNLKNEQHAKQIRDQIKIKAEEDHRLVAEKFQDKQSKRDYLGQKQQIYSTLAKDIQDKDKLKEHLEASKQRREEQVW